MKNGLKYVGVLVAAALVAAPLAPASARDFDHGRGGWDHHWEGHRGPGFGLVAGLIGAGAALSLLAAPAPVYAAPAPVYYAPQPVVYAAPAYGPPVYYGYRHAHYAYAYVYPRY